MTTPEQDRRMKLAREIVRKHYPEMPNDYSGRRVSIVLDAIQATEARMAAAVEAERERCADLADNHSFALDIDDWMKMTKKEISAYACRSVAAAIRSQSNGKGGFVMSDAERLAERLRELLAKATPGPWSVGGIYSQPGTPDEKCWWQIVNDDDFGIGIVSEIEAGPDEFSSDLSLIVEAVNSLPTLLARIAALEDALRERMERLPPEFETAIYSDLEGLYEESAPPKASEEQEPSAG